MDNQSQDLTKKETSVSDRDYNLLSLAKGRQDVVIRDDQHEFFWILDSVRACRRRGRRMSLVDSGKFDLFHLEWLGEAGADIYSSDEVRTSLQELGLISRACRRGRAILAYFQHGSLEDAEKQEGMSRSGLEELGRNGVYIHLTNRVMARDFSHLNELAFSCTKGRGWLVFYHHGPLDGSLERLARNGAWIHFSDRSLEEQDITRLGELLRVIFQGGRRLVLYLERGLDDQLLRDLIRSNIHILFKPSAADFRIKLMEIKLAPRLRKLDFRAYYLYTDFLH